MPHDALRPSHGVRNHRLCTRTDAVLPKVLLARLLHDENPRDDCQHALASLFHDTDSTLGSEEARKVALTLASVRLSNCTYGFPVCSFRKDFITAEMPEKELA